MRNISIIFLIILCFIFLYTVIDGNPNGYSIVTINKRKDVLELPFKKGEVLTYELRYKDFNVGKSVLTFHGEKELENREVYHIAFFTRLTAVTDEEELYAEKDTFLPFRVFRTIKRFGAFTTKIKEEYDQRRHRVDIRKKSKIRKEEFFIQKDSPLHNAILLSYYYRTKEVFDKNKKFKVSLPTVDFEVIFVGEETIETPLGEKASYAFTSVPSKFKLWLSTDEERVPLKIEDHSNLGYSLVIESVEKGI